MTDAQTSLPILVLATDLIFASKIIATARAMGVDAKLIRDPEKLLAEIGTRLIVDLNQPGTISAAEKWRAASGGTVVGFVSHVDTATIATARAAGVDRVIARSQFVQILPEILGSEINPPT